MEKDAAISIFKRSVEKHKLKYMTYVEDGDFSSFVEVSVALLKEYDSEYQISKEDCLGHIKKCMGSSLRKYKYKCKSKMLSEGATAGCLPNQGNQGKIRKMHVGLKISGNSP